MDIGFRGDAGPQFTLRSSCGVSARVVSYGAALISLEAPDRHGRPGPVVLGFDSLEGYLQDHPHMGVTVGRFANRIAGASFPLDGRRVELVPNEGPHQLHGGPSGFGRLLWQAELLEGESGPGVNFRHISPDGDQGFPGRLEVSASYRLDEEGCLRIDYRAQCDRPTPVNLTNHSYFNLRDGGARDVRGHELEIAADRYLVIDDAGIPTGELASVDDSPLDLRVPRSIGAGLEALSAARGGYDHCYVLRGQAGALRRAARVLEPESGRMLEVSTTQPGLQLYSGNFLDGSLQGPGGRRYQRFHGFCLETQDFPDAPNQPDFPDTILRPGATYAHTVLYRFSAGGALS